MRLGSSLTLSVGLISLTHALHLEKPRDGAPRVLGMDIQRKDVQDPVARDRLRKRQNSKTVTSNLDNEQTLYFANVSLGTPGQPLRLHIDTGSSDLWTNVGNSQLCQSNGDPCSQSGTYNANKSSTYKYVNSLFNISYEDGSGSMGDYATDNLNIGGAQLNGLQFGIGYQSNSPQGLLGLGYPINEAISQYPNEKPYTNAPQLMAQQDLIQSSAYSLWLNDLDASTGSILFGGVNTDKFTGQLSTLPIIPEQGVYAEFVVGLTGVGIGSPNSVVGNQAIPVLLDSGSSLMYLPNQIAQQVFNQFGAQYDESEGAAIVDCNLANNKTTLQFTFAGPTIQVGMNELVMEAGTDRHGRPVCILGLGPSEDSTPVLGDTFIRSAYLVYDLQNNQISIGQTQFNSTTDNVLEISSGTASVPSATMVPNAITSATVAMGGARNGGPQITNGVKGAAPKPTAAPVAAAAMAGAGLLFAL